MWSEDCAVGCYQLSVCLLTTTIDIKLYDRSSLIFILQKSKHPCEDCHWNCCGETRTCPCGVCGTWFCCPCVTCNLANDIEAKYGENALEEECPIMGEFRHCCYEKEGFNCCICCAFTMGACSYLVTCCNGCSCLRNRKDPVVDQPRAPSPLSISERELTL